MRDAASMIICGWRITLIILIVFAFLPRPFSHSLSSSFIFRRHSRTGHFAIFNAPRVVWLRIVATNDVAYASVIDATRHRAAPLQREQKTNRMHGVSRVCTLLEEAGIPLLRPLTVRYACSLSCT